MKDIEKYAHLATANIMQKNMIHAPSAKLQLLRKLITIVIMVMPTG